MTVGDSRVTNNADIGPVDELIITFGTKASRGTHLMQL
jgi:hypothetical protein